MDAGRADRQLRLIADTVAMSKRLGVEVWLRGGWAMETGGRAVIPLTAATVTAAAESCTIPSSQAVSRSG